MKKTTPKDYAIALYQVSKDKKGADLKQTIGEFAKLLFRDGKLKQIDGIIGEFTKYTKKQEGVVSIEITSATKINKTLLSNIAKSFGSNVETDEKINKDLIGGFIVRTEDKIFDGSVKTQLTKLKQILI